MRIGLRDPTVAIVDLELGAGVTADFAPTVDGLGIAVKVTVRPICATAADVPASV